MQIVSYVVSSSYKIPMEKGTFSFSGIFQLSFRKNASQAITDIKKNREICQPIFK